MTTREKLVDKLRRIQQTTLSMAGDIQNSPLPNDLSDGARERTDADGFDDLLSDATCDTERLERLTREAGELLCQYREETK